MRLSSLLHNRHTHTPITPNFNRQEEGVGVALLNDKKTMTMGRKHTIGV